MNRRKFTIGIVFALTVLAFVIRVWNLTSYPPALFTDEASVGYNAYSILTTLRDEHNHFLPVYFEAFGEYKNPLLIYALVPIIGLFDLSEFSTRLGSVIFGTLTVLLLYFFIRKMFGVKTGILAAFFLALAPWHIHYSRIAFELITFPLTYLIAVYYLVYFLEHPTKIRAVAVAMSFALCVYSYGSARIIMPLLLLVVSMRYMRSFFRPVWKGIGIFVLFLVLIAPSILTTFTQQKVLADKRMDLFGSNSLQVKATKIVTTYLDHFNPTYLFLKSEAELPGHFITRELPRGISYGMKTLALLFYVGIFILIFAKNRFSFILLATMLLYPIPGSISNFMLTSTRSIIGIVLICSIAAIGLQALLTFVSRVFKKQVIKKIVTAGILVTILAGVIFEFTFYYFVAIPQYALYASDFWGWQYGPKPIIEYFIKHTHEYDQLLMNGEFNGAYILPYFYGQGACGNCVIGSIQEYNPQKKQLFAVSPALLSVWKAADRFVIKKIIYYPNVKAAFYIGEIMLQYNGGAPK